MVIVSIGEVPVSDWIPEIIARTKGLWLSVNEFGQTSDPKVYAVGDVVKPGLLADAIGQGRVAALALHARATGEAFELPRKQVIPPERLKLIYFNARPGQVPANPLEESDRCISCGTCRDCNICVTICGQNAITPSRTERWQRYIQRGRQPLHWLRFLRGGLSQRHLEHASQPAARQRERPHARLIFNDWNFSRGLITEQTVPFYGRPRTENTIRPRSSILNIRAPWLNFWMGTRRRRYNR